MTSKLTCPLALCLLLASACAEVQNTPGTGGGGGGGTGGSGGSAGQECSADDQCDDDAPICDGDGTCRGCVGANECLTKNADTPQCDDDGRCVECFDDDDCRAVPEPVCDAVTRACRGCEAHSECVSQVCDMMSGACVDEGEVVYASPTGSGDTCTRANPCFLLSDAIAAVGALKPYLRLLPGEYGQRLSIAKDMILIGEDATLNLTAATGEDPGIQLTGSFDVVIDGLRVTNLSTGIGIVCTDTRLTLLRATVDRHDSDGIDCPGIVVRDSVIAENGGRGLVAFGADVTVERSLIADNFGGGIRAGGLFQNNLFINNSNTSEFQGALRIQNPDAVVAYNTFVDNAVNGSFIGIVGCNSSTVVTSNVFLNNQFPGDVDQTLVGCTDTRNNLADVDLSSTGTGNILGDALFVDAGNRDYTLAPMSPGIDEGEVARAPADDFNGEPRPIGDGPDVGAIESN